MHNGYTGILATQKINQYFPATGEWHYIIMERWCCHADELSSLVDGFRSGRDGYMMQSPVTVENKGEMREVTVIFGPVKEPETLQWYTSTQKGIVLNEKKVIPIAETAAYAAEAMDYRDGLPGNGMNCSPQDGFGMVACNASWGPPDDEEDAEDNPTPNKEIISGITVNGVELSVTPSPGVAAGAAGEELGGGDTDWRREVALLNEIIAGSVNQFPENHKYHPNKWYRGSKFDRKDADIIDELGTSSKWHKIAMEIAAVRDMAYPSIQISINIRTYKKKKQATLSGIFSKVSDVGKLYKKISVQGVEIDAPPVKSLPPQILRYVGTGADVAFEGHAIPTNHIRSVWKFNGPVVKTMGKGKWVREKYKDAATGKEKQRRTRLYEYEYSFNYQSMILLYNTSTDPCKSTVEEGMHPGSSEDGGEE